MAVAVYTTLHQLFDNSGNPLNGGTVTVQDAGTTTSRSIYSDTGLSVAATNPITLDSAGRSAAGILYTAATAYKVIVKNSSGTTLWTRDNIDPGVPIGSGYLAIANGGTGATSAGTALSNLGGATAAELADIAADVAALAGAASSSEKTQIAVGTTAQRPSSPANGQIRRNTTIPQWEVYDGTDWDVWLTDDNKASTADIAAETSGDTFIAPDRAKHGPWACKAWARVTVSGGTPALTDGYNFSGTITDHGAGNYTLTFSNAMANANYAVVGMVFQTAGRYITVQTATTTTVRINVFDTSGSPDDNSFAIAVFGDI